MAARLVLANLMILKAIWTLLRILIINFSFSANRKNSYYLEINLQLIFHLIKDHGSDAYHPGGGQLTPGARNNDSSLDSARGIPLYDP